jgi:hypothetical protein
VSAQKDPYEGLMEAIWLDSMTITAKKMGFDVNNFIEMVREDTSFYQAFKNLRLILHNANHKQEFFNEKGKLIDYYNAKTQLLPSGSCKEIKFISKEKSTTYNKKNGERKYLTAKLYERVFLPSGKICASTNTETTNKKNEGIIDYYYGELKRFIFQPGEKANIPMIGNKTALFSEKMRKYYQYGIESKNYSDGTPCYVFTIKEKNAYSDKKSGKTVVKFMETYFSRKDFQVMGREYEVEYPGPFFSFNIRVNVNLDYMGNKQYIPQIVNYSGEWDIPGRKKEIGKFKMEVTSTNSN